MADQHVDNPGARETYINTAYGQPGGNGLPLPYISGRCYGIYMKAEKLDDLVKKTDTSRFLFAHNGIMHRRITAISPLKWVYMMMAGNSYTIKPIVSNIAYSHFGTTNDEIICFELYGIALHESWWANDAVSDAACFMLLKNINSAITANSLQAMTDEEWRVTNEIITTQCNTTTYSNQVYSCMLAVIYSLCRTGSPTSRTKANLIEEFRTIKGIEVMFSDETVRNYWKVMGKEYTCRMITDIMKALLSHFTTKSIRLSNLVEFAKNRNLTTYYCIVKATSQCPDFYWNVVAIHIGKEMDNFVKARALVKDRPYFGYGNLGCAISSNYPNLAYICLQLCQLKLGQSTLQSYITNIKSRVNTAQWDRLISKYLREVDRDMSDEDRARGDPKAKEYLDLMANTTELFRRNPEEESDSSSDDGQGRDDMDDSSGDDDNDPGRTGGNSGLIPQPQTESTKKRQHPRRSTRQPPPSGRGGTKTSFITTTTDLESTGGEDRISRLGQVDKTSHLRDDRSRSSHRLPSEETTKELPKPAQLRERESKEDEIVGDVDMEEDVTYEPRTPEAGSTAEQSQSSESEEELADIESLHPDSDLCMKTKIIPVSLGPRFNGRCTRLEHPDKIDCDIIKVQAMYDPIFVSDVKMQGPVKKELAFISQARKKPLKVETSKYSFHYTEEIRGLLDNALEDCEFFVMYKGYILDKHIFTDHELYPFLPSHTKDILIHIIKCFPSLLEIIKTFGTK